MSTQKDTISHTMPVTDEIYKRMYKHRLGDDYDEEEIPKDIESDNFHIKWDDTGRGHHEAVENGIQGFVAEATFAVLLDQAGIEYEWGGGKGEEDFVINGKEIDVKSRQSKKEYRNLIKDYCMSNSDKVDFYIQTIVHYHPLNKERITAIEFLGYISNKNAEKFGIDCKMYQGNKTESKKKEVHPKDLNPVVDLISIMQN
jgi:hypothetical protein